MAALAFLALGLASAPTHAAEATAPAAEATAPALIARGAYLAKAADCAACHDAPDGRHFAGGAAINSPFGAIYGSNITPDPATGIGRYSLQDFTAALRQGVAPGGKRLYPAMPYASFAKVNDDDIAALYAYFMHGVPPVAHTPPPTRLPFPFNQRWGLMFWDWAFGAPRRFEADAAHDAEWNRGAYLVQGLGHCGACHTPRGPAFEERGYDPRSRHYLTGGVNDNWFAPSLRGDQGAGLGRFSQADLAAFLKTGHGGGTIAYGAMTQAVEESLQYLTDADASAIAHYLKSLPAEGGGGRYQPAAMTGPYAASRERPMGNSAASDDAVVVEKPGAGLYQNYCAKCHQARGEGVAGKYPALAGNPTLLGDDTTSPLRIILEGARAPATAAGPPPKKMPGFARQLNDLEIAQLLSYVRESWGNSAAPVTSRDVNTLRRALHR
ncbi:MAG: c-type cytochrome [Janthinobacterium lividum]